MLVFGSGMLNRTDQSVAYPLGWPFFRSADMAASETQA